MFRQQITQITNCTCKIIPDKNEYMMFRSPESFSNKKNYFKQKLSLKNHSTSAQKKYQVPISSQKKSLRDKKINENNRTLQTQTICNNFDTQKQIFKSPQHNLQKTNKYSFNTIIQSNSKAKINKIHPQTSDISQKRLIYQNKQRKIYKEKQAYQNKVLKMTKKIQDYQNDPLDFAKIDVNLCQQYKKRQIAQYQMRHNLRQFKKQETYAKQDAVKAFATNPINKNINRCNKQINQQINYSKDKQNQIQNFNSVQKNFNSVQKNFNFDKIKEYRKETIIQRQNPVKKPLLYMNLHNENLQTFHESLQKFYPKRNDATSAIPLIIERKYSADKLNQSKALSNNEKQTSIIVDKIHQSRVQYVKSYQYPQIILMNQSTVKESKSFATTVSNSLHPSSIQNSRPFNNNQTQNYFKDYFQLEKNQNSFQNHKNYNSSAFNSNLYINNTNSINYGKTDIKNEGLKTFNDLMTNQNETQSVYEDQDQNQNEFSQVLMSYRKIFQKSGILQPMTYRLLQEQQYQNKYQSQFKRNRQELKMVKQAKVEKQYLTNYFSTNE